MKVLQKQKVKAVFEEEERNNKKGAKANTGSAAKPIVNHQIDSDEAVLKIHFEEKKTYDDFHE